RPALAIESGHATAFQLPGSLRGRLRPLPARLTSLRPAERGDVDDLAVPLAEVVAEWPVDLAGVAVAAKDPLAQAGHGHDLQQVVAPARDDPAPLELAAARAAPQPSRDHQWPLRVAHRSSHRLQRSHRTRRGLVAATSAGCAPQPLLMDSSERSGQNVACIEGVASATRSPGLPCLTSQPCPLPWRTLSVPRRRRSSRQERTAREASSSRPPSPRRTRRGRLAAGRAF